MELALVKEWTGRIIKVKKHGYIFIQIGEQLIPEHRLTCEEILGRQLTKDEVIHHIDFNKENNNPKNLALFESQKAHAHWHRQVKQFGLTRNLQREIEKRKIINLSLDN
jgi:hypothetical protein